MRTEIIEILQKKYPEYSMQHIDTANEILRLSNVAGQINELSNQLNEGRHYLMSVEQSELNVEDALDAFGFGRNGLGHGEYKP